MPDRSRIAATWDRAHVLRLYGAVRSSPVPNCLPARAGLGGDAPRLHIISLVSL
jgi:hypothetical protein